MNDGIYRHKLTIPARLENLQMYEDAIERGYIHLFTQWQDIPKNPFNERTGWNGRCGFWILAKTEIYFPPPKG